jgi:Peptidase inhibitor family I36
MSSKSLWTVALASTIVAGGFLTLSAPQASATQHRPAVCLFDKKNLKGDHLCYHDEEEVGAIKAELNDKISSIYVARGWQLTVCADVDFTGGCRTFTYSTNLRSPFNNELSSYKIEKRMHNGDMSSMVDPRRL